MQKSLIARWRASFLTGLAIVLPGVITLAVVKWLFGTISSFTDTLLFFLPYCLSPRAIYQDGISGPMFWYWSLLALFLFIAIVSVVGVLARNYFGKQLIAWADNMMLRVPVLNKIYGTIKQLDEAFTSGKKSSFKTVVLVEYPREGIYSVGFITSAHADEVEKKTGRKCVCVFIPTTPLPTGGFLIVVPEDKVVKLDMSVAEGFKYIISVGALANESAPPPPIK
ncbi:MAG TPA: DUF502 domain-containing protein [Candidatus Limnocylindrales bacterium]|nr:DUF502 domain-containing protein [Candidatus Limnocylindrales bacterium]